MYREVHGRGDGQDPRIMDRLKDCFDISHGYYVCLVSFEKFTRMVFVIKGSCLG